MSLGPLEKQLLSAIRHYRTKEALDLLDQKIDLNAEQDPWENPLILAICKGNKEVIRKLVEKGADANRLLSWYHPVTQAESDLSEGHTAVSDYSHYCPLTEAYRYEEEHNLSDEIKLLRAHGAKELDDLR